MNLYMHWYTCLTDCHDKHAPWRNVRVRDTTPHPCSAFDTINQNILIRRLRLRYSFVGKALDWVISDLKKGTQRVVIGDNYSNDRHLDIKKQVSQTISACSFYLRNIKQISRFLPRSTKERVVNATITSRLDYCNALLYGTSAVNIARLQRKHNTAARYASNDIHEYADTVTSYINLCQDMCIPQKSVKVFGNDKPWFTKNLNIKLTQKEEAFKSGDRALYRKAKYDVEKAIRGPFQNS
ncbi:hypothetical protein NP493_1152g00011 [Ridgeia piscesae]|uniref:Uncharacterized protein n=1 Tax=Ridgeia piscesae TaxID=27915 RepID=A0AAD9NHH0_RIDPI|nr:hypothetical protein NP493_1152g00011 [Ridgeia piscesae]